MLNLSYLLLSSKDSGRRPLLRSTVFLCFHQSSFVLSAQAEHDRGFIRRTKFDRQTPAITVDPS